MARNVYRIYELKFPYFEYNLTPFVLLFYRVSQKLISCDNPQSLLFLHKSLFVRLQRDPHTKYCKKPLSSPLKSVFSDSQRSHCMWKIDCPLREFKMDKLKECLYVGVVPDDDALFSAVIQ